MPDDDTPVPFEKYCHEVSHAEWMQLMIHFYRGEMNRATVWRQRLDVTTNWAIGATAAMLTFMLSDARAPHGTVLLILGVIFIMLHIEARRYMYYDIWRARLRMIERGLVAPALSREACQRELDHEEEWRRLLAEDLHRASFHMPYSEALGRRLRRNYLWLVLLAYGGWLLKLGMWPDPARGPLDLFSHAAVSSIPGVVVVGAATVAFILLVFLSRFLTRHRHARGEAQPYHPSDHERWGIV
ncbi:MAG: DUF2270 domain-containing protein [Armatimonadia bacterium]